MNADMNADNAMGNAMQDMIWDIEGDIDWTYAISIAEYAMAIWLNELSNQYKEMGEDDNAEFYSYNSYMNHLAKNEIPIEIHYHNCNNICISYYDECVVNLLVINPDNKNHSIVLQSVDSLDYKIIIDERNDK